MSVDGLRMLRSAPALSLRAVADGVKMYPGALKAAVGQLQGRGCGARRAVELSYHHGPPRDRITALRAVAAPPFAARRAAWDRSRVVQASAPGVAGWASRTVDCGAPPRVAAAKAVADPATRFGVAAQRGCPAAMAIRLAAGHNTEHLATVTPHWVVLAALVTADDETTRRAAAARDDLHPMLAIVTSAAR